MKKQFYIIRHGQTDYNLKGIVQGRGIDSDLNEKGIAQALQFFEQYEKIGFDKIYTSTLKRTQQSVRSFLDSKIPHQALAGLDEMDWGIYEGQTGYPELHKEYLTFLEKWKNGNYNIKAPCGESPLDVAKRQQNALQIILDQKKEKKVLICMHGRCMRVFLCQLLNLPLSEMDSFPHQNLCLYHLEWDEKEFTLLEKNKIDHLFE